MPDLTIHTARWCLSNEVDTIEVAGSKVGVTYRVTWHARRGEECNCPGFKFRKTCKHIAEAEKLRCCFGQGAACGSPEPDDVWIETKKETGGHEYSCPKCGGATRVMSYGA